MREMRESQSLGMTRTPLRLARSLGEGTMPNQTSKKKSIQQLQPEYDVRLRSPHWKQLPFVRSKAKRKICRAGRRGGKTVGGRLRVSSGFLRNVRRRIIQHQADNRRFRIGCIQLLQVLHKVF